MDNPTTNFVRAGSLEELNNSSSAGRTVRSSSFTPTSAFSHSTILNPRLSLARPVYGRCSQCPSRAVVDRPTISVQFLGRFHALDSGDQRKVSYWDVLTVMLNGPTRKATRQRARDHFGGIKTSLAAVEDGGGGSVEPTKSPRSGARAVLCAAFFHCTMLSTILFVEPIAMWLSCK
jgi:hypothetical protein